mmetsp:Transcript_69226/g.218751  ORF Transcript_69226/g.218751 Transcript_69226/m.218751 type:complete len:260 (-) Transcript_69226:1216-1995(-)
MHILLQRLQAHASQGGGQAGAYAHCAAVEGLRALSSGLCLPPTDHAARAGGLWPARQAQLLLLHGGPRRHARGHGTSPGFLLRGAERACLSGGQPPQRPGAPGHGGRQALRFRADGLLRGSAAGRGHPLPGLLDGRREANTHSGSATWPRHGLELPHIVRAVQVRVQEHDGPGGAALRDPQHPEAHQGGRQCAPARVALLEGFSLAGTADDQHPAGELGVRHLRGLGAAAKLRNLPAGQHLRLRPGGERATVPALSRSA